MSEDPQARKQALRIRLRAAVAALSLNEKSRQSAQLRDRLKVRPAWNQARSVLLFWPLDDEPDIRPLILGALKEDKIVVLPRFSVPQDRYEAAQIRDLAADLAPGRFAIPEPRPACPSFSVNQLDLSLVPGIGFSIDGRRLGRGTGFYDRLLIDVSGITCGVAFEEQLTVGIPMEAHDIRLSCILTPSRWY